MNLLKFFRRQPPDNEDARRTRLLERGRIAQGEVTDIAVDGDNRPELIYYSYEISGIAYESSQTLDDAQRAQIEDYAPGSVITIRFDPRQPANSIVV